MNPPVEPSPSPPTPPTMYFCAELGCKPDGCHVVSSHQPPSYGSIDPLDFVVLCSSVPHSTCDVHEDQVLDGVGVGQPTRAIIFDGYVWESE